MDALDPAFAPRSHWEPGGLTTREAISYIHALPARSSAADIVDSIPCTMPPGLTAMVAAKILKESSARCLPVAKSRCLAMKKYFFPRSGEIF